MLEARKNELLKPGHPKPELKKAALEVKVDLGEDLKPFERLKVILKISALLYM